MYEDNDYDGEAGENVSYFTDYLGGDASQPINWDGDTDGAGLASSEINASFGTTEPVWGCWKASDNYTNVSFSQTGNDPTAPCDDVDYFAFHKNYSVGDRRTAALVFRGGDAKLYDSDDIYRGGFAVSNFNTNMGMGQNISGHSIAVEMHVQYSEGIEKIVVGFTSRNSGNPTILHDYAQMSDQYPEAHWTITPQMWDAAGCNNGFGRVILDWDAGTKWGAFTDTSASFMFIIPVFSSNSKSSISNPNRKANYIMAVREMSTIYKTPGDWRGTNYKIYASKLKNGVESMLYEYDGVASPGSSSASLVVYEPRIPSDFDGAKLYYQELNDNDEPITDMLYLGEAHAIDGFKSVNANSFSPWYGVWPGTVTTVYEFPPMNSSYNLESGYPDGVEEINARWKHAESINRVTYIGNVQQPLDTSASYHSWNNGKILKTGAGKISGFPDNQYIDLELGEDYITCMKSLGDRLIVFSEKKCILINVGQDIEFIEDTFNYLGVRHVRQVCYMEEGLAIINGSGLYWLNPINTRNPVAILSDKIHPYYSFDATSSGVMYEPIKKLLWVNRYTSFSLFWSWKTKSFVGEQTREDIVENHHFEPLVIPRPNDQGIVPNTSSVPNTFTLIRSNSNLYFLNYYGSQAGNSDNNKGVITSDIYQADRDIDFRTGLITCGDINRRKKFYNVRFNALNHEIDNGDYHNLRFSYSLDKGLTWTYQSSHGMGNGDDIINGENEIPLGVSGKHIILRFDSPPNNGTTSTNTFFSDISLVYRERTLK